MHLKDVFLECKDQLQQSESVSDEIQRKMELKSWQDGLKKNEKMRALKP